LRPRQWRSRWQAARRAGVRWCAPLILALAGLQVFAPRSAVADEVLVPARLQAALIAKVAAYDAKFAARANGRAFVLVVVAPGAATSIRFGEELRAQLAMQPAIGGLPHSEELVEFTSALDLARLCQQRAAAIVYVAPELSSQSGRIAEALAGLNVLSVAAIAEDVRRRLVLGFANESGRPKLVINLPQARLQNVAFNPELVISGCTAADARRRRTGLGWLSARPFARGAHPSARRMAYFVVCFTVCSKFSASRRTGRPTGSARRVHRVYPVAQQ
jgi:hypothetical protein